MLLRRFVLAIISWSIQFSVGGPPPAMAQSPDAESAADLRAYYAGNGLLQRGMFDLAEKEYRDFLDRHTSHEKSPMARYGLAVCLLRSGRYADALHELDAIAPGAGFPFAVEVQVMRGQCQLFLKQFRESAETLLRVVEEHADHKLAPDACVQLAEALYHSGQTEKAVEAVSDFQGRWPDHPLRPRALFFRGLARVALRDDKLARDDFSAVLKAEPEGPLSAQAGLLLAQCAHRSGDLDAAARQYERALSSRQSADREAALFGMAVLRIQQQRFADAAKLLDECLAEFPSGANVVSAAVHRGRAALELGDVDRAVEYLTDAQKKGAPADESAYWLAKCFARKGDHARAADALRAAIRKSPESRLCPELRFDLAVALYRAGDLAGANGILAEWASGDESHSLTPDVLHLLAVVRHRQADYDKSREACRAFLDRFGSHRLADSVAFLAAENLFLSGQYAQAAEDFERFLRAHDDSADAVKARYRLGMARHRLGENDAAAKLLAPICEQAQSEDAYRPALLAMADILISRGEWKPAEDYLNDYLKGDTQPPLADDALLKLAVARQRQGRHEQAVETLDELLTRFPSSPHALQAIFERGQCRAALSKWDEAKADFEEVLAKGADSRFAPHALNHLGSIALARGDAESAAKYFSRVTEAGADDSVAAQALYARAAALMNAGDFQSALEAWDVFIARGGDDPRIDSARANSAICLSRLDRFRDAVSAMKKLDAARLDSDLHAALDYERAWCLKSLGKKDAAAAVYRDLIAASDKARPHFQAMLELAALDAEAKRYDDAARLLARVRQAASSNDPSNLANQATYRLAVCEFERGRFAEAADLFEQFIKTGPRDAECVSAHAMCGEALFRIGRHGAAAGHLYEVADAGAKSPAYGPSLLRLGECLAALQRWTKSEEVFRKYLELYETSEGWHQAAFGAAWAVENQGRHAEAIERYRRIVDRHKGPTAARAQFQIGECLFALKQYDEAARELLKVDILYACPEWSAAALYEAGRCFEKLSKLVEARRQYKLIAEKYADTHWAKLAAERLSDISVAGMPGR